MRDATIALFLLGSLPLTLQLPQIGVLMWAVVSYMNPHQMAWGFARTIPFALLIAAATLLGMLISREPKRLPRNALTWLLAAMMVWITITTVFAHLPDVAVVKWERTIKILLMTMVTMMLMYSRERIHALVWIIVLSIGVYGVKGGLFTLLTGGQFRVMGPPNSMIAGNNEIALALVMILPLARYLHLQTQSRLLRLGMMAMLPLLAVAIIGSYSRGAFLAITAMGVWLFLQSRRKGLILVLIGLLAGVAIPSMPDKWFARMQTIETYEEDSSAMSRIEAWRFGFEVAKQNPVTGGGFLVGRDERLYLDLVPDAAKARAFHSIWFEMMGEHGFVGLGLFVALGLTTFFKAWTLARRTRADPQFTWVHDLMTMVQVSLVGYVVGGTFLNLAFFDLPYHLVVLVALCAQVVEGRAPLPARVATQAPPPRPDDWQTSGQRL